MGHHRVNWRSREAERGLFDPIVPQDLLPSVCFGSVYVQCDLIIEHHTENGQLYTREAV
jgi:hypothetical protein